MERIDDVKKAFDLVELPDDDGFNVKLYLNGGHTLEGSLAFDAEFVLIRNDKEYIAISPKDIVALSRLEY